jgi:SAM-dependent methyltransferase
MFDEVAERYKESLERNHRFIPGDVEFYSEYKVQIAAAINTGQSVSILDYGCGVGLSLPHLKEAFPDSKIYAHDPSIKSVEVAQKNYNYANFDISQGNFDLIFNKSKTNSWSSGNFANPETANPLLSEIIFVSIIRPSELMKISHASSRSRLVALPTA